jgi:hypothetical protein
VSRVRAVVENVDHFQRRVLMDALREATAAYWLRRAKQFEWVGNARCDEIAQACRNRAAVSLMSDDEPWVSELLDEVAS